jgi:hypothetical protein
MGLGVKLRYERERRDTKQGKKIRHKKEEISHQKAREI